MTSVRKPLYERLPEIYRIRDAEQLPPDQLKAFLDILDTVQEAVRADIEALHHDFFIETCSDWVVPYLADLLGTSHLSGDAWTLRADVARTVHHRRRKGTLGAVESLTYTLTGWAAHTVELRERLLWNQHLNHQRPDEGGPPPLPLRLRRNRHISGAVRGGTLTLRDPAMLNFLNGPFDPFAHLADVKPVNVGSIRYNLPNLAIFLWRLRDYTAPVIRPLPVETFVPTTTTDAAYCVRFELHPLGQPMVLFNTHRFEADDDPPNLTHADAVPGPMPQERLTSDSTTGNPEAYLGIEYYATTPPPAPGNERSGLTLHLPAAFNETTWQFRGANLCAWEDGVRPPLREHEIVVDPDHGRLLIGVSGVTAEDEAVPIRDGLFVSATYGASGTAQGSTGAHPIVRSDPPPETVRINYHTSPDGAGLQQALETVHVITEPLCIEIEDSRTYELDLEDLRLGDSLHLRAASGQRPIIRLRRPLAFRPADVESVGVAELNVILEGLYITWEHGSTWFEGTTALIEQAALNELKIVGCTLDPGSHMALNGVRQNRRYAFRLDNGYGLGGDERDAFEQTPKLVIEHSICGPIAADDGYSFAIACSIIDAASGVGESSPALAVHAASGDTETAWGPSLSVTGVTCFGRMRVEKASGEGGIWLHRLEVHDNQSGCIRFSYLSGDGDRLPELQACVAGTETPLSFVSEVFGEPGYGQLGLRSHRKVLEQGPGRDEMGAFGYLHNAHKWKNINIRYREFMPVGVRPVLVPVT